MKQKRLFLQWAVAANLIVVGSVYAHRVGWFDLLYEGDATKLSFVILAIFALATLAVGRLCWQASRHLENGFGQDSKTGEAFVKTMNSRLDDGATAVQTCTGLGMLGTVIGIIMAFPDGGFSAIVSGDAAAMAPVLDQLTGGFSTAFLTTAAGLICAILLDVQLRLLAREIEVKP